WTALRLQALGDGIGDAAAAIGAESRRAPEEQSESFVERQEEKINNGLDVLEKEVGLLEAGLAIGHLSVTCSIGYLDFRNPDFGWRPIRPKLDAWFEAFSTRPSIAETVPQRS
ncbi:MAG: glutathione binding-like protein, partial [Rhodospirillales bacterium]|nr:glutathione binding-like protein [Rhodospirillales bacterium]